jgi:hypothetical protein
VIFLPSLVTREEELVVSFWTGIMVAILNYTAGINCDEIGENCLEKSQCLNSQTAVSRRGRQLRGGVGPVATSVGEIRQDGGWSRVQTYRSDPTRWQPTKSERRIMSDQGTNMVCNNSQQLHTGEFSAGAANAASAAPHGRSRRWS